jgi:hypothetical protein
LVSGWTHMAPNSLKKQEPVSIASWIKSF